MANAIDEIGAELNMPRRTNTLPSAFPGWAPYTVPETDLEYGLRIVKYLFDFYNKNQKKSKHKVGQ